MFVLTKVLWIIFQPLNLAVVLLLAGLGLGQSSKRGTGWKLIALGTTVLVAISVLPLDQWLARPLENRYPRPHPPAHVTGILVLGGGLDPRILFSRGATAHESSEARLVEGAALARAYPNAELVFSGGSGELFHAGRGEADVARVIFSQLGIPERRLVLESQSRNTFENILFSKRLVRPKPGETWLLVTSACHLPRAMGVARHLGWNMVPWPAAYISAGGDTGSAFHLSLAGGAYPFEVAIHEWIGLVAYRLEGRTDALWP